MTSEGGTCAFSPDRTHPSQLWDRTSGSRTCLHWAPQEIGSGEGPSTGVLEGGLQRANVERVMGS